MRILRWITEVSLASTEFAVEISITGLLRGMTGAIVVNVAVPSRLVFIARRLSVSLLQREMKFHRRKDLSKNVKHLSMNI